MKNDIDSGRARSVSTVVLPCVMEGVREYAEEFPVELRVSDGRIVVRAKNEGGHNVTEVDLFDLLAWYERHKAALESS